MKLNPVHTGRRAIPFVSAPILLMLALTIFAQHASAQTQPEDTKPADHKPDAGTYQTLYLTGVAEQHDANDIVTDLRNILPMAKIYYVESRNAISIRGSAGDIQLAQKILSDIDRPRKTYRLTYSITETDGGKQLGTQKVALIVVDSGGKTTLKQGSRVPIVTGTSEAGTAAQNSQVQYVDIGLDIEASVDATADGVRLHSKVAQSSVAEDKSSVGALDPAIRQTFLEGIATLVQGKPQLLGSLDIPGTTRHEEVEVVSELVP
jgi:type II secretory pathway component GspD/PulD (secretin)